MADNKYKEWGRQADALIAEYYKKPDDNQLNDILKLAQQCIEGLVHSNVKQSRENNNMSGVPAYIDPEDIINITLQKLSRALKGKKYKINSFNNYAVTAASNALIDTIRRKKFLSADIPNEDEAEKDENPRPQSQEPQAYGDMPVGVLMEREILNAILRAERSLDNETAAAIWVGRAFLGLSDKGLCEVFDMPRATVVSHFRRACVGIHQHVCAQPGFEGAQFDGLKTFVQANMDLRQSDIELVKDPAHKKALTLVLQPQMDGQGLAEGLQQEPLQALATLRQALIALSQAKVKRAKPVLPTTDDPKLDDWLWKSVEQALAQYPDMAPATRAGAVEPGAQELADLCAVAVALGFSGASAKRQSLGELITSRMDGDPAALAKEMGITEDDCMAILSDTAPAGMLDTGLLSRLMKRFGITKPVLAAAMRTPPQGQGSPTRGLSGAERDRYYARLRRDAIKG